MKSKYIIFMKNSIYKQKRNKNKIFPIFHKLNLDKIPTFTDLFGKKTQGGTEFEILGCKVSNSKKDVSGVLYLTNHVKKICHSPKFIIYWQASLLVTMILLA